MKVLMRGCIVIVALLVLFFIWIRFGPLLPPPRFPEFQEYAIDGRASFTGPQWSPDGRYVAYLKGIDGDLIVYDTQTRFAWAAASDAVGGVLRWTPTGEISYFTRSLYRGHPIDATFYDLHQIDLDGSNDLLLASQLSFPTEFAWFADGNRLLISLSRLENSQNDQDIYLLNLASGDTEIVVTPSNLGFNQIVTFELATGHETQVRDRNRRDGVKEG
jgi:hypothetical protein